jgi:hypothetical protein
MRKLSSIYRLSLVVNPQPVPSKLAHITDRQNASPRRQTDRGDGGYHRRNDEGHFQHPTWLSTWSESYSIPLESSNLTGLQLTPKASC